MEKMINFLKGIVAALNHNNAMCPTGSMPIQG